MPIVVADELRELAAGILAALGTPADVAIMVGDALVEANLAGHDSHGIMRLPGYVAFARKGDVRTDARPAIVSTDRATARVDGLWGWGQPAMWLATDAGLKLAAAHGVGCVVVNRCFHIGRVAPYVEAIARAGMIGIAMSNAGPAVAPHGGRRRLLGTNPLGWAVPRGSGQEPLSFDIATAALAEGKLQLARATGRHVPRGVIVTADGKPSTDPDDFYRGGAILPFGGHKGYGVNLLAQVLGAGLAGMDTSGYEGPAGANGPVLLVIDIAPFIPPERFTAEIDALCARILGSAPASGHESVLLPGDRARENRRHREAHGIPIAESTWTQLSALAGELGVRADVLHQSDRA